MKEFPSQESIQKIAECHFLEAHTQSRVHKILWLNPKADKWKYKIIWKGLLTTTFLMTLGKEKFALKISDNPKFIWDTETEKWLYDTHSQNVPHIFSSGEWILPGMDRKFFWNIQEYISWPIWSNEKINDSQLESFIWQLSSLHSIKQPQDTKGWGKIWEEHEGENKTFDEYMEIYMSKVRKCEFFNINSRRERIQKAILKLQKSLWNDQPVLIHNDAHPGNVILDSKKTCRLIDFGNIKWSYPEEELAVIKTHCVGSRMWVFDQIITQYKQRVPEFDETKFQFFLLINTCTKITTRKELGKQEFLWRELIEPILTSLGE